MTEKFTAGEWYTDNGFTVMSKNTEDQIATEIFNSHDAHLIAAAPDMYRALRAMLDSISETGSVNGRECTYVEMLLAKARGESD